MKGSFKIDRLKDFFIKTSNKKSIAQLLMLLIVVSLITVIIVKRKTINLVIDGKKSIIITYKDTVGKALENNGIIVDSKDKITPALNLKIHNNGTILLKRAVNVQITVDGKNLSIKSAENTVDALLKVERIALNEKDKIQPLKGTPVSKDMKIGIVRVDMKTFTSSTNIPFNTVVKNDSDLPSTVRKTIQDGKVGQKSITTNVVYENGTEVSRTIANETIVTKPVDTIIAQGTLAVVKKTITLANYDSTAAIATTSRGGNALPSYSKVVKARATAYEPTNGLSSYTASGRKSVRDPNGYSTIAVDPNVIPLGSKVFVEGYGLAYAADTGGAIKGTTIDVFFNTSNESNNWGVKYVDVYILN